MSVHNPMRLRSHYVSILSLAVLLVFFSDVSKSNGQLSTPEDDIRTLKSAKVDTSAKGLQRFFQQRILSEQDHKKIEAFVSDLDSKSFETREAALTALVLYGRSALPYLEKAVKQGSLESRQRAQQCILRIGQVSGTEIESAAVRRLVHLQPEGTLQLLLDYYASGAQDLIKEELLAGMGRIGVKGGKVDPVLLTALSKGKTGHKAAAAFLIAQRGGPEYRSDVRKLLTDAKPEVRKMVVRGFLGSSILDKAKDRFAEDNRLLRNNNVNDSQQDIIDFLKRRSLTVDQQQRLKGLIRNLGHPRYATRLRAFKDIMEIELPAVGFLLEALNDDNPEIVQRAEMCIWEIRKGPGPALPEAAVRLMIQYPSRKSVEALITYLPFAPDETVEQQIIETLCLLSTDKEHVTDLFVEALNDPLPARKSAAAYILGKIGTKQECEGLDKLLEHPHKTVKFRTAMGLLAAKNKQSIPTLIDLLEEMPKEKIWEIEATLRRLAGDAAPDLYVSDYDPKKQTAAIAAWKTWWTKHKGNININDAIRDDRYLGLFTICEYDSANNRFGNRAGGRIWECGRDGKVRWEIKNVMGPMDAQVLRNGRVLIAESNSRKVTERDKTGKIVWEYMLPTNPINCQRLPNGNTFIATYRNLMEVTPDKRVVYNHNRNLGSNYYTAKKLRDGTIVATNSRAQIVRIDSANGKVLKTISIQQGGWNGVDVLPNGNYLVSEMSRNLLRELDRNGKLVKQINFTSAFRAHALPNGNRLVVGMNSRKVAEVDFNGKVIWEQSCQGRPWNVQFR